MFLSINIQIVEITLMKVNGRWARIQIFPSADIIR